MGFCFSEPQLDARRAEIRIPARVSSEAKLFELFYEGLSFPDYFGSNWDALSECLKDFEWLEEEQVVIRHDDLPLSEDRDAAAIYLRILARCVKYWEGFSEHSVIVVFPPEARRQVDDLMA